MPKKAKSSKKTQAQAGIRVSDKSITTGGLLRKTIYFSEDEWRAIRQRSFETDERYTEIVRTAVRKYLGL